MLVPGVRVVRGPTWSWQNQGINNQIIFSYNCLNWILNVIQMVEKGMLEQFVRSEKLVRAVRQIKQSSYNGILDFDLTTVLVTKDSLT